VRDAVMMLERRWVMGVQCAMSAAMVASDDGCAMRNDVGMTMGNGCSVRDVGGDGSA